MSSLSASMSTARHRRYSMLVSSGSVRPSIYIYTPISFISGLGHYSELIIVHLTS
ncbi:hypothetical protein PpBr36_00336 [Pyricularia pennisetigena]|uniref:hypothetical protein n=1 Tax=Pyricularia pennisetigena TaxID=1578925 RepID=UPI001153AD1E|nr:hypothetical protein PpBr36_00336 [Pyricularia pennisetigena]TLS29799.1 hypothetical protein PpBr36_00336 [Pyricularia pennisetigena]